MYNNVYWKIRKHANWYELHVSQNKEEVLSRCALSRKIPIISKFAEKIVEEWRTEMKAMGKQMIELK